MNVSDFLKPGAAVLGLTAAAALGFAAAYIVARDPQLLRRTARALAGGVERVTGAFAESREELADLWAEVREHARQDIEAQAFDAETIVAATAMKATQETRAKTANKTRPAKRQPSTRRRRETTQ